MPGPGEPLWLDDDRDAAVALLEEEANTCEGCGHPKTQSMHPSSEGRYVAEVMRCHACAARTRKVNAYTSAGGDAAGLMVVVSRKED